MLFVLIGISINCQLNYKFFPKNLTIKLLILSILYNNIQSFHDDFELYFQL